MNSTLFAYFEADLFGAFLVINHYQDSRAMSLYLAFMYPEAHYLYKTGTYREAAEYLGVDSPGNKFDKVVAYRNMCGKILAHLKEKKPELIRESDELLGDLVAYDPEYHLLVQDIMFFITWYDKQYQEQITESEGRNTGGEIPVEKEYNPGINTDEWVRLIKNPEVFTKQGLEIVCRIRDVGDFVTCSQLAQRYGETEDFYLTGSENLAKRVVEETDCKTPDEGDDAHLWPVLYIEGQTDVGESDTLGWRLRDELREALGESDIAVEDADEVEAYTDGDFLSEVYVSADDLADMRALLSRKRNLILQGSPGTGKTFCARRLAWAYMGSKDDSRITFVQFHQSTTYDDFVCGYRPDGNGGFIIKDGPFVKACRLAAADSRPHFVIIDEINRANVSKVLGDLLMLIEADHRGESVLLTVSGKHLEVPENLYILGMMNTADRGLALIDYALRRRFAFFEMAPALAHPLFLEQLKDCSDPRMDELVKATREVNRDIADDAALGPGFSIGHSYFCGAEDTRLVLRYELAPLIREYWFDDPHKVKQELSKLERALQ